MKQEQKTKIDLGGTVKKIKMYKYLFHQTMHTSEQTRSRIYNRIV